MMPFYKPINWAEWCANNQTEQVLGEDEATSYWVGLLNIICEALKSCKGKASSFESELQKLKLVLKAHFPEEAESLSYFEGDYQVFCAFLAAWAGYPVRRPMDLSLLWPSLLAEDRVRRYTSLVSGLMAERGCWLLWEQGDFSKAKGLAEVKVKLAHWDKELKSYRQLMDYRQEDVKGKFNPWAFLQAFKSWFLHLLKLLDQADITPLELLEVQERVWTTAENYQLLPLILDPKGVSLREVLLLHKERPHSQIPLKDYRVVDVKRFNPSPYFDNPINTLLLNGRQDLKSLSLWAKALFRQAALLYIDDHEKGMGAYLNAFKQLQEEMRLSGEALYACRMKAAEAWQTRGDYLSKLDTLDAGLLEVEQALWALPRTLIEEMKTLFPDNATMQKAAECFEVVCSDEMRVLEAISWAEMTCYCRVHSEQTIASEMDERLKKRLGFKQAPLFQAGQHVFRDTYHITTTFTQTDYLMTQYVKDEQARLRKDMTRIHPDKLCQFPEVHGIANYCIEEIQRQRERYGNVSRAWYAGQWYALLPGQKDSLPYGPWKEFKKRSPVIIKEPKHGLGLGMISLHCAYLEWIKTQPPSLAKQQKRGGLGLQHALYCGSGDPADIASSTGFRLIILSLREYQEKRKLEDEAIIAQLEHKIALDQQKIKKLKEALTRINAVADAETEARKLAEEKAREAAKAREAETKARKQAEEKIREAVKAREADAEARKQAEEKIREAAKAREADAEAREQTEAKLDKYYTSALRKQLETNLHLLTNNSKRQEEELNKICLAVADEHEISAEHIQNLMRKLIHTEPAFKSLLSEPSSEMSSEAKVSDLGFFAQPCKFLWDFEGIHSTVASQTHFGPN
jgi:hypothetical protein